MCQGLESARGQRRGKYLVAAVVDGERILPQGLVRGEVIHCQDAAQLLYCPHHALRQFATVKDVAPLLGDEVSHRIKSCPLMR